jgi:hypothetical protein
MWVTKAMGSKESLRIDGRNESNTYYPTLSSIPLSYSSSSATTNCRGPASSSWMGSKCQAREE